MIAIGRRAFCGSLEVYYVIRTLTGADGSERELKCNKNPSHEKLSSHFTCVPGVWESGKPVLVEWET